MNDAKLLAARPRWEWSEIKKRNIGVRPPMAPKQRRRDTGDQDDDRLTSALGRRVTHDVVAPTLGKMARKCAPGALVRPAVSRRVQNRLPEADAAAFRYRRRPEPQRLLRRR
jgi:hypothetical protein